MVATLTVGGHDSDSNDTNWTATSSSDLMPISFDHLMYDAHGLWPVEVKAGQAVDVLVHGAVV